MSAASAVKGIMDRLAIVRQNTQSVASSGTDFWDRADGADDETFENRVKGSNLTAIDAALASGKAVSEIFRPMISDLAAYYSLDLSLSGNTFENFLLDASSLYTTRFRIPFEAAESLVDLQGESARLAARHVYPKGTRPDDAANPATAGMHEIGTLTGTAGAPIEATVSGAIDTDIIVGAGILLINKTAATSVTDLVLECTLQDGETTKDLTVTLAAATQYKQTILGAAAVNAAGAAAGQPTIPVKVSTAQFAVGELVLIAHDDGTQEIGEIESMVANTSITLTEDLVNSFVEDDLVIPLYTNAKYKSGTVADGKVIGIYAYPDRKIAL